MDLLTSSRPDHKLHEMSLPAQVLRSFQKVPENPLDSDFLGAYNKLLYVLFPSGTDFMVDPNASRVHATHPALFSRSTSCSIEIWSSCCS